MTLFPIFVAAWSVLLWSEQTKSHKGGNSCLHKVFGFLLPLHPRGRRGGWWLPTMLYFIASLDCVANADNSLPAAKKLFDLPQVLLLPLQSLVCPWLNGALAKLQGKHEVSLNTIAIVLWCEITGKKQKMWFGEITVPVSMYACPTAFPNQ